MQWKKFLVRAMAIIMLGTGSVAEATVIVMDATHHNGSFTTSTAGYWSTVGAPEGWAADQPAYAYTTASKFIAFSSGHGLMYNNTGETVGAYNQFTLSADLGGGATAALANVYVYATENADGSGEAVELAHVSAYGTGSYTLTTVSNTGAKASSSIAGYYVQVRFVEYAGQGYYDNIVVTSETIPEPATAVLLCAGSLLVFLRKNK